MAPKKRTSIEAAHRSSLMRKKAPTFRRELSSSVDLNFRLIPDQPIAGA
jgi:hypothetical protein